MVEPASKKPKLDLSQNKANVMLRKAAEGKYGIPGVCVVSVPTNWTHKPFPESPPKPVAQQSLPQLPSLLSDALRTSPVVAAYASAQLPPRLR